MKETVCGKTTCRLAYVLLLAICASVLLFMVTGCQVKTNGKVETGVGVYH